MFQSWTRRRIAASSGHRTDPKRIITALTFLNAVNLECVAFIIQGQHAYLVVYHLASDVPQVSISPLHSFTLPVHPHLRAPMRLSLVGSVIRRRLTFLVGTPPYG